MCTYRKFFLPVLVIALIVATSVSAADQLDKLLLQGKTAFVIVTGPGAVGLPQVQKSVQQAVKSVGNADIIEIDRTDSLNAELVAKYELAAAPVPLVLVFAANGALGGGLPGSMVTPDALVALVPSPKQAATLKALQDGQAVYVTAARANMSTKSEVASGCAAACSKMMGKCVAIEVNMDDPAEKEFLSILKVDLQSTEPVTVVINAQGEVTESFTGNVEVTQLVQAVSKKVSGGCCPPGSGKTCPPTPQKKGE